jgi:hypothetical protein
MAKFIVLECKWGSGTYTWGTWKVPLKFRGGRVTVSQERLEEVKTHPKFGIEFGLQGTIYEPYGFRSVKVQRSEGPRAGADDSSRIVDDRIGSPRERAERLKKELKET